MSSDIKIKKLEFDFEITDTKYYKYIFNLISGKVNFDFNKIISRVLNEHEVLISSNNLRIDNKSSKKIDKFLNQYNKSEINSFNKVTIRNFIKNFFLVYAG